MAATQILCVSWHTPSVCQLCLGPPESGNTVSVIEKKTCPQVLAQLAKLRTTSVLNKCASSTVFDGKGLRDRQRERERERETQRERERERERESERERERERECVCV